MEEQGKVCTKCGKWKTLEEYYKNKASKDGKQSACKKCQKECQKQYRENNKEYTKEYGKQWRENNPKYSKQWRENNKEHTKEYGKQWRESNPEYRKQHYQNNKEYEKKQHKQWCEQNKEYRKEKNKQWRGNNKEYIKEKSKEYRENNKEHIRQYREEIKNDNIVQLTEMLKQVNPIFEDLNIKAYGSVYKITNIKTDRCYIGQTINSLNKRYTTNVIKGWIEERLEKVNQKFTEELIEEDFVVDEVIAIGVCKYHLDKLEAYYINKYNSCENGYNNECGNHNTNDGLEEFNKILEDNGLKFIDGKIITI